MFLTKFSVLPANFQSDSKVVREERDVFDVFSSLDCGFRRFEDVPGHRFDGFFRPDPEFSSNFLRIPAIFVSYPIVFECEQYRAISGQAAFLLL